MDPGDAIRAFIDLAAPPLYAEQLAVERFLHPQHAPHDCRICNSRPCEDNCEFVVKREAALKAVKFLEKKVTKKKAKKKAKKKKVDV